MNIFKPENIIDHYKLDELMEIIADEKRAIMDFLPAMRIGVKLDQEELNNWKQHFTERGDPWAVTQNESVLTLWKEKVAGD